MRTIPFVLCAAAIVAACVLSGCGREPVAAQSDQEAITIAELEEGVHALGAEEVFAQADNPQSGYTTVEFGGRTGPIFAAVVYDVRQDPPTATLVRYVSERNVLAVRADGTCTDVVGRPTRACTGLSRAERKKFFREMVRVGDSSRLAFTPLK